MCLAVVAAIVFPACHRAGDGGGAGDVDAVDGASAYPEVDHQHYLRSVEDARLELVEPGTNGAWREIRGAGRVVRLASPPERIASRTLVTDEILLEIAEPERIVLLSPFVADPQYSAGADKARRLGRVGGFSTEEMLLASPDLVFAAGFNTQETIARLEAAGVPVVVLLDHEDLAAIERNIRVVGFAIGRDREAERLAESMRQRLEAARARAGSRVAGLRVVHWSGGVLWGSRTVFDDALGYLGAVNLAAENGLEGWSRISAEQVVAWDPDVIFTDAPGAGRVAPGALDSTRAARLGNVESLDGRDMAALSHHVAAMVERLADALVRASDRLEAAGERKLVTASE